jgi:hypothetical protein
MPRWVVTLGVFLSLLTLLSISRSAEPLLADASATPAAFVFVPAAYGAQSTPTVTPTAVATATATNSPTPTVKPVPPDNPTNFSVSMNVTRDVLLKWTAPEGQNLYYHTFLCYLTIGAEYGTCAIDNAGYNTVVVESDPAPIGSLESKTVTFSRFTLPSSGYVCFWVPHKFGLGTFNNPSTLYPKSLIGDSGNCVLR